MPKSSIVLPQNMIPSMMSGQTVSRELTEQEKKKYADARAAAMNHADKRTKFRKSRVKKSPKKSPKKSKGRSGKSKRH